MAKITRKYSKRFLSKHKTIERIFDIDVGNVVTNHFRMQYFPNLQEYGDIQKTTKDDHIVTTGYHLVLKK